MKMSIGSFLIDRLAAMGVSRIYGVPGDYNLEFLELLGGCNRLLFVGTCNELNAAYAADYYVQWTSGRGFAGPSIWRKMSDRFQESGKESMTLLVVSDHDPEGLALADETCGESTSITIASA